MSQHRAAAYVPHTGLLAVQHYFEQFLANVGLCFAVYLGMNLYFQKVKKTYRPLATYTREAKSGEAGAFTADLDSAEEV